MRDYLISLVALMVGMWLLTPPENGAATSAATGRFVVACLALAVGIAIAVLTVVRA